MVLAGAMKDGQRVRKTSSFLESRSLRSDHLCGSVPPKHHRPFYPQTIFARLLGSPRPGAQQIVQSQRQRVQCMRFSNS